MPHYLKSANICLVGTGQMAVEYVKVLKALGLNFNVVGRGEASAKVFIDKTSVVPEIGGFQRYLETSPLKPECAIIAVGVEDLYETSVLALEHNIRRILVEKPAGMSVEQIENLYDIVTKKQAEVYVAYNRRFYSSVLTASKLIEEDKGLLSFHFDFTEFSHVIEKLNKSSEIKDKWFLANSTHVIDLAFFLGGRPIQLHSITRGGLSWHPRGSIFSGAGITDKGAVFSYHANWDAPGRWGIELMTRKRKIRLQPLEQIEIQTLGSLTFEKYEFDNAIDRKYKPGLYKQVKSFLNQDKDSGLLSISNHYKMTRDVYSQICNLY